MTHPRTPDIIDVRERSSDQQFKDWMCGFDIHDQPAMMELGRAAYSDISLHTMSLCTDQVGVVMRQAISVFRHALAKPGPQRLWKDADPKHPAIARALKLDPSDPNAFYSLFPFRLGKVDEQYRVLVAIDPPAMMSGDWHHIDIDTVLAWDVVTNTCEVIGDIQPQLVMPSQRALVTTGILTGDTITIYGDPFQYFRAFAERRAIYRERRIDAVAGKWSHPAHEIPGDVPGLLLIGDPYEIRWPALPKVVNVIGADQKMVRSAIFRSADIPDVVDANLRAVA